MKTSRRPCTRFLSCSLARCTSVFALAAALSQVAHGAVVNWDPFGDQTNSGGFGTWDLTSLVWNDDGIAPDVAWPNTNADTAVFGGFFGSVVTIDTAGDTGVTANGLIFNVTNYEIAAAQPSEVLTLAGTTPTVTVTNALDTAIISAVVAGTSGLTKAGNGTLTLSGSNTFTGGLTINAGTLAASGPNGRTSSALGAGPVIINSGSDFTPSLQLRNNGQPFPNIAQGGTVGFIGAGQVPSTITYGNDVVIGPGAFNVGIDVGNNGANSYQQMVMGALTVNRPVQLNITGQNNYSLKFSSVALGSDLTVNPTTAFLRLDNVSETGGPRQIIMSGFGELQLGGNGTFTGGVTVNSGTLRLLPTIGTTMRPQGTGPLTLSPTGTLGVSSVVGTLSGVGAVPGGLTAKFYQMAAAGGINSSPFFAPATGTLTQVPLSEGTFFNRPPVVTNASFTNGVAVYSGLLNITTAGNYTFQTSVDDQSQLVIDGVPVISVNTGAGGTTLIDSPTSVITLSAGLHTITMKALNNGSGGGFKVTYNGPDSGNVTRLIPTSALLTPLPFSNVGNSGVNKTIAGGDNFTLDGGGTDLDGGINNLTFTGSGILNVTNAGGTGAMTVSGTTTLQASPIFNPNNGILALLGDVVDSGGTFSISKTGQGMLLLNGAKTFGGALTISAGSVQVTNANSLGSTSAGTSVEAGAVLDLNGVALGAEPLTLAGSGIPSVTTGALYNSSATLASASGPIALGGSNPRITGFGDITLSGVISDGTGASAWTKGGPNTLFLTGNNTFTVATTVATGLLKIGSATALGTTAGNTTVSAGAALDLNGFSIAEPITISGTGIVNFGPGINGGRNTLGALINSSATAVTLSGAITMAANANVGSPTLAPGGDMTFSAPIGGAFTLSKVGGNTVTFTAANTFSGTIVNSGKVILSGAGTIAGFTLNPNTTIDLDNSVNNVNNRLQQRGLNLLGGNFNIIGNPGAATTENLAANIITINSHFSTITLTPSGGFGITLTANSGNTLTRSNNGTVLIRGTNLGGTPGAGTATVLLTGTIPTVGQAGAAGAANRAIIPWALVDTSATGQGVSFASHIATNGLRALQPGEFSTSVTANNNIVLSADNSAPAGTTLINSLTLGAGGSTLTIGAGNTLNLDSGGLLATSSWTINGGTLNSNANREIVIHSVGAGTNLTINSVIGNTTTGVTRSGNGTLTLGAKNTFAGSFRINGGLTVLAGGENTLFFPNVTPPAVGALTSTLTSGNLVVNGGTLDLNGNDQRVGGLGSNAAVGVSALPGAGGTITNTSATTATLRFSQGATFAVATSIAGNLNVVRDGGFTITLTSPQTYTGTTTLNGGLFKLQDAATLANTSSITINRASLNLDNSQIQSATRISPTTPITLKGGALTYFSRSGGTQEQLSLGTVTAAGGASLIQQNLGGGTTAATGSSTINIANLVRTAAGAGITFGTVVNNNVQLGDNSRVFLAQVNGAAPTLVNGILPPWLTVLSYNSASAAGGTSGNSGNIAAFSLDFATYDPTTGLRATTYQNGFDNVTNNTSINGFSTVPAGGATINTLRLGNGGATLSFGVDTEVLNLQAGGLISSADSNARNVGTFADNGRITAGGTNPGGPRELFIYNASNTLTVNSRIIDNPTDGSAVSPVFSAASQVATIQLTAPNTFTGTAYVNGVIMQLSSFNGPAIPGNLIAGGNSSNGGDSQNPVNQTIRLFAPDQFATTSNVTINGGTLLDLNGFNTVLNNLTFGADGGSFGNQGPAVQTGAGILTLNGNIDATNLIQATTIPLLTGNVTLSAGTHNVAIGSFPGALGQVGFQINAIMDGLGGLNLTSGILGLGSLNTVPLNIGPAGILDVRNLIPAVNALTGTGVVTGTTGQLQIGNGDGSGTFDGTFVGTLSVLKRGTGTEIFTNTGSTFTGGTIVDGGTLQLGAPSATQSVTGPGIITINNGGTIAGLGQAAAGFVFNPGSRALVTPAPAARLTTGASATIRATGPVTINLTPGALTPGTYQLIDYGGTALSSGQFAAFTLGNTPGGGFLYGLLNDTASTAISLSVETVNPTVTWTGATNNVWDTTTANWTPGNFVSGNQVVFNDSGANKTITGGPVSPQAITVTNSVGNDYSIANAITGTALAGGLVKNGNGSLTLTGANTFSGPITVNGGTIRASVSSAGSGLGSGAITFANGTNLILDPTASMANPGLTLRSFTGVSASNVAAIRDFTGNADFTGTSFATGGVTTGATNVAFYPGGPVDNFASQWTGKINITTAGIYSFFSASDDGSRVFIDGRLVAMNDGSHGTGGGNVGFVTRLAVGLHDIRIDFTEGTGGNEENLRWQGPGIALAVVPSTVVFTAENASNAGSTNNIILGNNITIPANLTVNLTGTTFTGVQVGGMTLNPGSKLVVGSASGKQFRAGSTQLSGGTVTIDSTADVALGQISDGGTPTTIVKDGPGRLILDNSGTGGAGNSLSPSTTFEIRLGDFVLVGGINQGAPAGTAKVRLNGGRLILDTKGSLTATAGNTNITNSLEILQNSTIAVIPPNGAPGANNFPIVFGNASNGVTLATGTTLTVDVYGGARSATALGNNFFGNTIVANSAGLRFDGIISGDGAFRLVSTQFNGGNMPAIGSNGGVTMTAANTYTGATTVVGQIYNTPNVLNAAPLTLTLSGNGSITTSSSLLLQNGRVVLDYAGTNLSTFDGRISDGVAVNMNNSVLQFIGSTTGASNESFGDLVSNSGLNLVTMSNVNSANSTSLTGNQIVRNNRSQLVFQGATLGAAFTNADLIRFITPPTVTGGPNVPGSGARDIGIIRYGVATANATGTVTWGLAGYDTGTTSVRPIAAAEYTSVNTPVTGSNDNARDQITAALAITGRSVNAYVLDNTSTTAAQTATVNGTLTLGSGLLVFTASSGTQQALTMTGGAVDFGLNEGIVFVMNNPGATLASTVQGSAGLTVGGFGQLALTGDNSATLIGPITLNGQLSIASDAALGISSNPVNLNGGTLRFSAATTLNAARPVNLLAGTISGIDTATGNSTISGPITGGGSLAKISGNTLTLSNPSYTGQTAIYSGTLVTTTTPQGDILNNGSLIFTQASSGAYTGTITGNGSVVISSPGQTITFGDSADASRSPNFYSNGTTVNAASTLRGTTTSLVNTINTAAADAAVVFDQSFDGTISTTYVTGIGTLTKAGNGTITLEAAQTNTGGTNVTAGTLALGGSQRLSDTGPLKIDGGTFSLGTNAETVAGVTLVNGNITGTTGVLTGSSYSVQNGTISAILGGSGALVKTTTGTVVLSGANTYTGPNNIIAGRLVVNGTNSGTGVFNVLNSGTLAGTGTVAGSVSVQTGGTLDPGVGGAGAFTLAGLQMTTDSVFAAQIGRLGASTPVAGTDYDQVRATGSTLDLGGATLTLTLAGNFVQNDIFTLILNQGSDTDPGAFAGLANGQTFNQGGFQFQISYFDDPTTAVFETVGGSSVSILVTIPEPSSTILLAAAGVALGLRRRKKA